jgi:hypothetical protein
VCYRVAPSHIRPGSIMRASARAAQCGRVSLLAAVTFHPAWLLATGVIELLRREEVLGVHWLWVLLLWGLLAAPTPDGGARCSWD